MASAQEGKTITVDEGDGKKRKILTDSKEYADLYNEDRIGVKNDDESISFNPLNEVVVTPYDEQYPFYQELSDEEKKYFNDDTPIGRAVRRKAYTKNSLYEDVTDIAAPILYGTAAAMLAPYALAPLAGGLEFAGAAAAPYIEGALATSLPGMSSIPGATVGNAINAGFAGHGLYNIAPDAAEMYKNPSWSNAGNVGMDVLEIAPVAGPAGRMIGEGISTAGRMLGAEEGLLSNAWKLNPKAYQYNLPENTMWRGLGKEGMEDAVSSGLFRSKQDVPAEFFPGSTLRIDKSFGINPYFTPKFKTAATYGDNFLAEVPRDAANWRNRYGRGKTWSQVADRPIPIDEGRILQKDWLQGYKPIEVPKTTQNFKSEIDWSKWNKEIPDNPQLMKEYNAIEQTERLLSNVNFSNYLTPKEAAAARAERMLAQESKWQVNSNTSTRDKFENINDNFEEIYANEIGRTPGALGTNALGKAFVFKDNGLSAANQSRVAAHETGHFYRNMADEANEWNSFFDFSKLKHRTNSYLRGKPTASKTSSYSVSEPKVEGLNLQKQGVPHGDEIRERAAQLKDYIAQKNDIPLNKDFIVTEAQLDDAIKNYVKDTGLDNTMTPMLNSLKDKKGFLKAINKYALGVTPLGLGAASQTGEEKPVPGMKQGGVIKDDRGQWNHPGEITEIGSNQITMQGVPYPVLGVSDTGDVKLMKPGKDYKFKGKKVTEFPMAKNGIRQEQKGLVNLDQLTNFTNYNTKQPGGWMDKYQ
jgi:hypothetical protein